MTNKELHVAVDIYDEYYKYDKLLDKGHIDDMMSKVAGLGATRVEWIVDTIWGIYDHYEPGFDLLSYACEAAHREGMSIDVAIKPFETALSFAPLPDFFPRGEGHMLYEDLSGAHPIVHPFVVENTECCMQRHPDDVDVEGKIGKIVLVQGHAGELEIDPDKLVIKTGRRNGELETLDAGWAWEVKLEYRPYFRWQQKMRIIEITNLDIPKDHVFVEISYQGDEDEGPFNNETESIMEWYTAEGKRIPLTPSFHNVYERFRHDMCDKDIYKSIIRYFADPDVRKLLEDQANFRNYPNRLFGYSSAKGESIDLSKHPVNGVRGLAKNIPILNPVYPKVREYWKSLVSRCLDCGADGINIRIGSHFFYHDSHRYGFNEPSLEGLKKPYNLAEVARRNTLGMTELLKDCRDATHEKGKRFMLTAISRMLKRGDENHNDMFPPMFNFPIVDWISDLADEVVFRGAMGVRDENLQLIVDEFALACREAKIPYIYQSNRRHVHVSGEKHAMEQELLWIEKHPDVSAYQLYESAYIMDLKDDGKFEMQKEISEVMSRHFKR